MVYYQWAAIFTTSLNRAHNHVLLQNNKNENNVEETKNNLYKLRKSLRRKLCRQFVSKSVHQVRDIVEEHGAVVGVRWPLTYDMQHWKYIV